MKVSNVLTVAAFASVAFAAEQQVLASHDITNKILNDVQIAQQSVFDTAGQIKDDIFSTWNDADLKAWAQAHGLEAPDRDELADFAKKHKDLLLSDIQYYTDEAKKTASPFIGKAGTYLSDSGNALFDNAVQTWSDSRLKQFLESRSVEVPETPSREELVSLVKKYKNKAIDKASLGSWTFDSWSTDDLAQWLKDLGDNAADTAQWTRDQLVEAAGSTYNTAKDLYNTGTKEAKANYDVASKKLGQIHGAAFDKWSESDLRDYLKSFGIKVEEATNKLELQNLAKTQYHLFSSGTANPSVFDKVKEYSYEAKAIGADVYGNAEYWYNKIYAGVNHLFGLVKGKTEL